MGRDFSRQEFFSNEGTAVPACGAAGQAVPTMQVEPVPPGPPRGEITLITVLIHGGSVVIKELPRAEAA